MTLSRLPRFRPLLTAARHLGLFLLYGLLGALSISLWLLVKSMNARPDLQPWHLAVLDQEFTAASPVTSMADYFELENRLFAQLDAQVYALTDSAEPDQFNRYRRGSRSDPGQWAQNWNRSFEWPQASAQATVLLLHGLSDSPYSLRALGRSLHASGAHVLGLRIPGHGTAPSGLLDVRWEDMAAAVRLAVRHLNEQHPDRPLFLVGYSNGGALALNYALASVEDPALQRPDRLVLIAPEIGVSSLAAYAKWQARIGRLLGQHKLAWLDILPDYQPFKYDSFTINAADLSHRITAENRQLLDRLEAAGRMSEVPPILAFTPLVDATVDAPALVRNLFGRLAPGGHELVVFDINRHEGLEPLLTGLPAATVSALRANSHPSFSLRLVTNQARNSAEVVEEHWGEGHVSRGMRELHLAWPGQVFSLSHLALSFPPDDPLYGVVEGVEKSPGLRLGSLALRGESKVLRLSQQAMLRQRWNPFYPYLEQLTHEFLQLPIQPTIQSTIPPATTPEKT